MYFPFVPQFFLVVLIICPLFCTVTFRSGNTLKQQTFFFQLPFQRNSSFHTTCSLLLLSSLIRDWPQPLFYVAAIKVAVTPISKHAGIVTPNNPTSASCMRQVFFHEHSPRQGTNQFASKRVASMRCLCLRSMRF